MRHILRSSSNTATDASRTGAVQDARLPPSGRGAVHALANKMAAPGDVTSPQPITEQNEFSGLISRAKDGLSSSSGRTFHKPDAADQPHPPAAAAARVAEKSETQIQWEEIEKNMARALKVRRRRSSVSVPCQGRTQEGADGAKPLPKSPEKNLLIQLRSILCFAKKSLSQSLYNDRLYRLLIN